MQMVRLKNGAEEAEPLVAVTMMSLRNLLQQSPIAFYELVMLCRKPGHKLFGNADKELKALSLVDPSGHVHDSIRNIVLSATSGEGLNLSLGSPI